LQLIDASRARKEHPTSFYSIHQWDWTKRGTGLTPSTGYFSCNDPTPVPLHTHSNDPVFFSNEANLQDETKVDGPSDKGETMEYGWSDNGLDFDDEDQDDNKLVMNWMDITE